MTTDYNDKPWKELEGLVEGAESDAVEEYLDGLTIGERARAISRLKAADQTQLLENLPPPDAADLLEELPEAQAARIVETLAPDSAATILHELPSDEQVDLLGDLTSGSAEAILEAMEPGEAAQARRLSAYDEDTAGGIMITELLAYPDNLRVDDVVWDLRQNAEKYRKFDVQYLYITTTGARLCGVLPLREVLLAPGERLVHQLMIPDPVRVLGDRDLDHLEEIFDRHRFLAVPVVDDSDRLVGVVRKGTVERALHDRASDDYRKSAGLVKEELRSMPAMLRARRRLVWLSINILLNVMAASVIAFFQDTLSAVIALAVFLPIISDMSGCSGNQAVAVSMRELALGLARPQDAFYVIRKEAVLGLINGLALGTLIGLVAWLWKGNPTFGLVVGGALALNTMLAVIIGGAIPLILKRLGKDPALASGPILTTVTDMCGFLIVLGFATACLPHLAPVG